MMMVMLIMSMMMMMLVIMSMITMMTMMKVRLIVLMNDGCHNDDDNDADGMGPRMITVTRAQAQRLSILCAHQTCWLSKRLCSGSCTNESSGSW